MLTIYFDVYTYKKHRDTKSIISFHCEAAWLTAGSGPIIPICIDSQRRDARVLEYLANNSTRWLYKQQIIRYLQSPLAVTYVAFIQNYLEIKHKIAYLLITYVARECDTAEIIKSATLTSFLLKDSIIQITKEADGVN